MTIQKKKDEIKGVKNMNIWEMDLKADLTNLYNDEISAEFLSNKYKGEIDRDFVNAITAFKNENGAENIFVEDAMELITDYADIHVYEGVEVKGYFESKYRGLAESETFRTIEEANNYAYELICKGNFVTVEDKQSGELNCYSPDIMDKHMEEYGEVYDISDCLDKKEIKKEKETKELN